MGNSANKTQATPVSVSDYLANLDDPVQRGDAQTLRTLLEHVSGYPATMWGTSIIGFGTYHYIYDSGREGDMCRIGFSPRKGKLVLYIFDGFPKYAEILARLGKHKTGKSCLYITRLADVDSDVLAELCTASLAHMQSLYPQ
jgi:hypothetical protein